MRRYRRWTALLVLLLLTGCGLVGNADQAIEKPQPIKLTIMHNWTNQDGKAQAMRALLEKFRSEHPDIQVVEEGLSTEGLKSRLRTLSAADELPDLFVMWPNSMTKDFVKAELLQPIDDYLGAHAEWSNNFIPGAFEGYTVDGRVYTVPMNLAPTSIVYYNQALFDRYSVTVPTTWEELLEAIRVFNEHGVTPIALGNKAPWVVQSTIFSTLADRITGSEWFDRAANQDGAAFIDPEFIAALETLKQLGDRHAFQDGYNIFDENEMMQFYMNGKSAMVINGGWAVSTLVKNAPQDVLDHTRVTILPSIEGGKGVARATSGVVGTGLGVNRKLTGERKEAALSLFYALAGPEGQQATFDSSTLTSYKISLDKSKAHRLFVELHELVRRVKISPVYDSELDAATIEVVNNGLQELLLGAEPMDIASKIQKAAVGK